MNKNDFNNILKNIYKITYLLDTPNLNYEDWCELHRDKKYLENLLNNIELEGKIILIGDVTDDFALLNPIECFERAYELSKLDDFTVRTNNPQVVEALEVLCGEGEIVVLLCSKKRRFPINIQVAYNYLGDVYDIIDSIRIRKGISEEKITDEYIQHEIDEYNTKYNVEKHHKDIIRMVTRGLKDEI